MDKVFEQAVCDFHLGQPKGKLLIHNTYGKPDEMPLAVYFRTKENLSDLENYALELCQGKILDVGAGLGALSLILLQQNHEVTALEISSSFCAIMRDRGVKNILKQDFLALPEPGPYDTLLMMMNGFGWCGSIARLTELFKAIDRCLAPGGQVIFDSSDVTYLFAGDKPKDHYFGEIAYQYEYDRKRGPWFNWLYVDSETLGREAQKSGFELQVLYTEESGQYLGRLTRR